LALGALRCQCLQRLVEQDLQLAQFNAIDMVNNQRSETSNSEFHMRSAPALRPLDIAVLFHLSLHPGAPYAQMAAVLGVSKSTAHAAIARLLRSGLAHTVGRNGVGAAAGPTREFLQYGAAYAFPPVTVPKARRVPTGFSVPAENGETPMHAALMVWPSRLGTAVGMGVQPLVPAAPDIALRDPALYRLLALVDALRVGDAREREVACRAILEALARIDA